MSVALHEEEALWKLLIRNIYIYRPWGYRAALYSNTRPETNLLGNGGQNKKLALYRTDI